MEVKTALYTLIAVALVAPVAFQPARPTRLTRLLGNRALSYLGQISYGVFLWQYLVIDAYFALFHARDVFQGELYGWPAFAGILTVVVIATVAVAAASYFVIELPAQRLYSPGRRLARPRGRARQSAGQR
jgi:peptidoglycan/LPS O-acetylase OafA/YrhL